MSAPLRAPAAPPRPPASPAGRSARVAPASFIKHSGDIAAYFGFKPMRELERERERGSYNFIKAVAVCATAAQPTEPALGYFASPAPAHVPADIRASNKYADLGEFGIIVAGAEESLAEVVLIRTLSTILAEWGTPIVRVRLNALGDKDSKMRFGRELGGYLRKHHDSLDEHCRDTITTEPAAAYLCRNEVCRDILRQGPRAMNFLSEKSRLHFREVLEHIESVGLPYELDDLLMGDERDSRVTFAIDTDQDATVVGTLGGRFDDYVRRLAGGKGPGASAASIYFRKGGLSAASFTSLPKSPAPRVYFVQLGLRAKLRGLEVVDMLRQARVPTLQSFDARSLSPQLLSAKQAGISHLLIMGAREALDGTVLLRTMDNSSQTVVALKDLPRFLKNLR